MAEAYVKSLKEELFDLPDYYLKLVDENFDKYIRYRYDQGYSMSRIINGLGNEKEIAERYRFFSKLHQLHGRRRLKGSGSLIKKALDKNILPHQFYGSEKSKLVFKSIFFFIIGIVLSIVGASFLIGNIDNPWGLNVSVVALSIFIFVGGLGCFNYIFILVHKFRNNMLSASMDGCKLDYFGQ